MGDSRQGQSWCPFATRSLLSLVTLLLLSLQMRCYYGQETQETQEAVPQNETKKKQRRLDPKLLDDKADWGTFYDPKDIFCGKYDCYKILGFDFRTFYTNRPTTKEITKNYRALSRHWHPDKNSKKGAKDRFVVCIFYSVIFFLSTMSLPTTFASNREENCESVRGID